MKKAKLLPEKLSDCIFLAADDVEAAAKKGISINMDTWVTYSDVASNSVCSVCFAGAVMLGRKDIMHYNFPDSEASEHNARRYSALDSVRCGEIGNAVEEVTGATLSSKLYKNLNKLAISPWMNEVHPAAVTAFTTDMRRIATELAKLGF